MPFLLFADVKRFWRRFVGMFKVRAKVDETGKRIARQLRNWRSRWRNETKEEEVLNQAFAVAFQQQSGKVVLDYLIETYYKPLEFVGKCDSYKLAERNGQQILLVDIMSRYDRGTHPLMFEEESREETPQIEKDPRSGGIDMRKI